MTGFVQAALWLVAAVSMILGCIEVSLGGDVWFHLLNGKAILAERVIPHADRWLIPLTDVAPRFFPNYEWLFGVMARTAWNRGGYAGIDILRGVLILTAFLFVGAAVWRRAGTSSLARHLAPALLLLGYAAASVRFEPRPHLVSAAGLALLTLLVRMPGVRGAVCLIPAALLWANCHIEVLFGIVYAVIWLVPDRTEPDRPTGIWKYHALYIGILVAAAALSPAGSHLVGQAGSYYEGERLIRSMGFWNVELVPMTFEPYASARNLLVLLSAAALLVRLSRTRTPFDPEALSAATFIILPFISIRYIITSSIVLVPFLAGTLGGLFPREVGNEASPKHAAAGVLGVAVVLLLSPAVFLHEHASRPHPAGCAAPADAYDSAGEFPDAAVRFLSRNGLGSRVFSHDKWGNFLAFYDNPCAHAASAPVRMPYMNAMFQTMPRQRVERYLKAVVDDGAWRSLSNDAKIDAVLLPYPDEDANPWRDYLLRISFSSDWKLVWWDDTALVYLASSSPWLAREGRAFSAARPDRWIVTGSFPESPADRAAALDEMRRAREAPEGERVIRTLHWMASLMMKDGDATATIRLLENVRTKNESQERMVRAHLGEAYSRQARWAEAYDHLSVAAREPASSAVLFYNLAVAAARSDRLPEAAVALERCLACDSSFGRALELRAILAGAGVEGF
ncbi:tetratricopeptide repeat protein [Candidatus Ozemobacteraceae bacterium]|nr:tetratricopeptide repeat protein [Candidatus Ozemobacteraceae bacterium]